MIREYEKFTPGAKCRLEVSKSKIELDGNQFVKPVHLLKEEDLINIKVCFFINMLLIEWSSV